MGDWWSTVWRFLGKEQAATLGNFLVALGTIGALIITLTLWRLDKRRDRRAQADRILVWPTADERELTFVIRNTSDQPIYEPELIVRPEPKPWRQLADVHNMSRKEANRAFPLPLEYDLSVAGMEWVINVYPIGSTGIERSLAAGKAYALRLPTTIEYYRYRVTLIFIDGRGWRWVRALSGGTGKYKSTAYGKRELSAMRKEKPEPPEQLW